MTPTTPKEAADMVYKILLNGSQSGTANYKILVKFMSEIMGLDKEVGK